MYSYENLNEETKKVLHKAIEIYHIIRNKAIIKEIFGADQTEQSFIDTEKRVLSLYISVFIVENEFRDKVLNKYKEFDIDKMLEYIDVSLSDIKELDENEYIKFYNEDFKKQIEFIIKTTQQIEGHLSFEKLTPEVIFYSFRNNTLKYSDVLNNLYIKLLNNPKQILYFHEIFKETKKYGIENGSIHQDYKYEFNYMNNIIKPLLEKYDVDDDFDIVKENDEITLDFNDDKIWDILTDIQKKFIGQEKTSEYLFYNIVNNQQLAQRDDVIDGERAIIFLDGPTGTGKTAITREITDKLDIPFTSTSLTKYSASGYVGDNITDTLKSLYEKANGNLTKAERGIIVFDEFDKISYKRTGGLEMKKAVQQQLLDFMGGGKYNISVGEGVFGSKDVEFDTSKLTFICLGALTDLREKKIKTKKSIGFESSTEVVKNKNYSITPQDLIDIGIERELVGRFNTYLHTEEYSKETLLKILHESTISPIISLQNWISSKGKILEVEEGTYEEIVDAAYELNTGARSLQTIVNSVRTPLIKDVLRGNEPVININPELIKSVNQDTVNRKGIR